MHSDSTDFDTHSFPLCCLTTKGPLSEEQQQRATYYQHISPDLNGRVGEGRGFYDASRNVEYAPGTPKQRTHASGAPHDTTPPGHHPWYFLRRRRYTNKITPTTMQAPHKKNAICLKSPPLVWAIFGE